MRLIYIVNARIPTEKAHGVQIMKSCEAFAQEGVNLELWVPNRVTQITQDIFDFYGVKKNFVIKKIQSFDAFRFEKYLGKLSFWIQSILFLRKLNSCHLELDTLVYTRNAEIAWLFARKGHRVVYEAHQWPTSKVWLYQRLLRNVPFIVCNSQGTETEFKKHGFTNTLVSPNGVDLTVFSVQKNVHEVREHLHLPLDKKIVMYTGHLYAWKGTDVIVSVAKALIADTRILFVLVGGTKKDIQKYQNIIEKENLSSVVLCGHKTQGEIPDYLSSADVLLLPNIPISEESERYTSPIKMFEYMASRKPIVASDLPSIREILGPENAILAIPGNTESFAKGVTKAIEDVTFVEQITSRAFSDVQNYTWKKRAQKILYFLSK